MAISLVIGVFLVPLQAKANILSAIFGLNDASASVDAGTPVADSGNSQNMQLLQANTSPISTLDNKNSSTINQNTDVSILSDNALLPATGPLGVSNGTAVVDSSSAQTSVYVVRKGDTLSQIADMFGVSVNTILWANNMKKGDTLSEGDLLFIMPISGLEHTVTKDQTLASIAKLYSADVNDIVQYNNLAPGATLTAGDKLFIPNAQKSAESSTPIQNLGASIAKDAQYYVIHPIQNLTGYYVNPVPGATKSQGIHDNNAVDLAIASGTPIHAAASGTVLLARTGYNGGFGNIVVISHPNGTQTLYAHQSRIATHTGEEVSQGEVIGYVGSTGRSTGPHLHFEVHGARNPGANGSWAY